MGRHVAQRPVAHFSPDGVDVVLHFAGDGAVLAGGLTGKGRLASSRGFGLDQHPAATAIMANPTGDTLDRLAADVAGRLTVPIERSYPLAEVPAAFDELRRRHPRQDRTVGGRRRRACGFTPGWSLWLSFSSRGGVFPHGLAGPGRPGQRDSWLPPGQPPGQLVVSCRAISGTIPSCWRPPSRS
jgi:hypothetical protein